jgi:dipeptidyl-peptidase-4
VFSALGGNQRAVAWDYEAFPYLAEVVWDEGAPLTLVVQNRRQTEQIILAVDDQTLAASELHREQDDAWLNFDHGLPRWINDGQAFLWTTELNGAWQLELRDRSGKLLGELT